MGRSTSSPNTVLWIPDDPKSMLRCDRKIDQSYIKLGSNKNDYAKEPWLHYDDVVKSYLSLRFADRETFLSNIGEDEGKIRHELERIQKLRDSFTTQHDGSSARSDKSKLITKLEDLRREWKGKVVAQISDIRRERQGQLKELKAPDGFKKWLSDWDAQHLNALEEPKNEFNADQQNWANHFPPYQELLNQLAKARRQSKSNPPAKLQEIPGVSGRTPSGSLPPTANPNVDVNDDDDDSYYGFKAGVMYFRQNPKDGTMVGYTPKDMPKLRGKFPDQKIPMKDILTKSEDNPLTEACPSGMIRYFHFPSNNMDWIEKAIDRYYEGNKREESDRTRIRKREYWEGQMHGSGPIDKSYNVRNNIRASQGNEFLAHSFRPMGPVHARHMRAKCSLIPREGFSPEGPLVRPGLPPSQSTGVLPGHLAGPKKTASFPRSLHEKNIALFLPYLHWETSSRRARMVEVINNATGIETGPKQNQGAFSKVVDQITSQSGKPMKFNSLMHRWSQKPLDRTCDDCENDCDAAQATPLHCLSRRDLLRRYLLQVARVAEEMDYEADERLLRDNINKNLSLHIRRTLDQYYFVALDNTSERDKDQVVYRGTRSQDSRSFNRRVVMVDQLWLWILDDHTIITSFPRRWGRNKPDASGVHKSLRERLKPPHETITSINHLAMIIVDQCSNVFFDRTKLLDERPEVMDMFTSAIGDVAYSTFWKHTRLDSQNMIPTKNEAVRHKYLHINPEGVILEEGRDIAEELMIMKQVYTEQLKVVKDFHRHLIHPKGKHAPVTGDTPAVKKLVADIRSAADLPTDIEDNATDPMIDEEDVHEAHALTELIEARQAEIIELEEAAKRVCTQLEGLLSLKHQQASIVEARAAFQRAEESVKQGQTIQAFTIVTIIFLPLGFIATFFGMNNDQMSQDGWMSLWEQIKWMFGGSAIAIFISVALAFSAWHRAILKLFFKAPLLYAIRMLGIDDWWKTSMWNHTNLERWSTNLIESKRRKREKQELEKLEAKKRKEMEKREGRKGEKREHERTYSYPGMQSQDFVGDDTSFEDKTIRKYEGYAYRRGELNGLGNGQCICSQVDGRLMPNGWCLSMSKRYDPDRFQAPNTFGSVVGLHIFVQSHSPSCLQNLAQPAPNS